MLPSKVMNNLWFVAIRHSAEDHGREPAGESAPAKGW